MSTTEKKPYKRVYTGPCGCGMTPEEHAEMTPQQRGKHVTVRPDGSEA